MNENTPLNQASSPTSQDNMTTMSPIASSSPPKIPWWKHILLSVGTVLRAGVSLNLFLVLPHIVIKYGGDYYNAIVSRHVYLIPEAWKSIKWNIWQFYALTGILTIWGSISILVLGGRQYFGPPTSSGYKPAYTHSGWRFYLISMAVTVPLVSIFEVRIFYDEFVSLIGVLMAYGFIFSVGLYVKARISSSNPADDVHSGNALVDFWHGIELYPRIGNLDIKTLVTCRHCLFLLQIIYLTLTKANTEINNLSWNSIETINWQMLSVTILQTFYLAKWFYWEDGYKNTIDFIVERGGYYLMGACIALIPSLYSLYNLFLVTHSPTSSFGIAGFVIVTILGIVDISCIYLADRQRQLCRDTNGNCKIWGKEAEILRVTYKDANGVVKNSLLLSSGFWGLSRHPNYFFEICMFAIWSSPAAFSSTLGLWYSLGTPIFVFLIMFDRSRGDDKKCKAKYGDQWDEYCKRVPYKIIPYVY